VPYQPPTEVTSSTFGKDNYKELELFIKDKCAHLDRRLQTFRTDKLPEYVRLYKARPKSPEADWPWPGAANLVIPVIGTACDELLARVMGGIWMYDPLWAATMSGDLDTKDGEELKQIIQQFLMDMAYSPKELDLYRVSQSANHSAIKYGTGVVYTPYEFETEIERVYVSGGLNDGDPVVSRENEFTKFDGPHPELLPLNRFGFDPSVPKLENMKFFYHIDSLDCWGVQDLRAKSPYYKQDDIDYMLQRPDAVQETEMEKEINEQFSIDSSGVDTGAARWYIYSCNFTYIFNGRKYAFIAKYHKRSEKVLYITFNNYPKNMLPYQDMKLAYDDESYLGTGFAEMVHMIQKELSNNNNWRTNNRNYAMLGAWRFDPESKLGSMLDVFPGVGIPAKEGEVEYFKTGADLGYSDGPDQFHLSIANQRTGVGPATGGAGGGIVNPKKNTYSAAGTAMTMQQDNSRNSLRTGDMRSAHVKLGLLFLTIYSHFGIGDKIQKYGGSDGKKLLKALDMYKSGQLGLRLRQASAMMNKDLERQNDILLSDRLDRFYQSQAQMIQAIQTPNIPPELQKYYCDTLLATRASMQTLLRVFNKDNTETILPSITDFVAGIIQQQAAQQKAASAAAAGSAGGANGNQINSRPNPVSTIPSGAMGQGGVPAGAGVSQAP
jgi:hypothetical protein